MTAMVRLFLFAVVAVGEVAAARTDGELVRYDFHAAECGSGAIVDRKNPSDTQRRLSVQTPAAQCLSGRQGLDVNEIDGSSQDCTARSPNLASFQLAQGVCHNDLARDLKTSSGGFTASLTGGFTFEMWLSRSSTRQVAADKWAVIASLNPDSDIIDSPLANPGPLPEPHCDEDELKSGPGATVGFQVLQNSAGCVAIEFQAEASSACARLPTDDEGDTCSGLASPIGLDTTQEAPRGTATAVGWAATAAMVRGT